MNIRKLFLGSVMAVAFGVVGVGGQNVQAPASPPPVAPPPAAVPSAPVAMPPPVQPAAPAMVPPPVTMPPPVAPAPDAAVPAADTTVSATTTAGLDDYIYYPALGLYYNRTRHQYVYLNHGVWTTTTMAGAVPADTLQSSPFVHMEWHDSPKNHHADVVQQYPQNWTPLPGGGTGRQIPPTQCRSKNAECRSSKAESGFLTAKDSNYAKGFNHGVWAGPSGRAPCQGS